MSNIQKYDNAVKVIKTAILESQYEAAKSVNERQLMLYYHIGKYISQNSREGFWGKGAIDAISEKLNKELPGLRGFSARNLRYMRMFYEEWSDLDSSSGTALIETSSNLALASAKSAEPSDPEIWHLQMPKTESFPSTEFFSIGFTRHRTIFEKVKDRRERCFYIRHCAEQNYTVEELKQSIARDDYHHQGSLPNNFMRTISAGLQALKAIPGGDG